MSNWIFIDEKFYTRMNAKISVFLEVMILLQRVLI